MATTWAIAGVTVDGFPNETPPPDPTAPTPLELWFDGQAANQQSRYDSLLEYAEFAHVVVSGTDINGDPWFRQRQNANDPVTTHVVDVVPGGDVNAPGYWGLVVGGGPADRGVGRYKILTLEILYLAPLADYADASAVESALGETLT